MVVQKSMKSHKRKTTIRLKLEDTSSELPALMSLYSGLVNGTASLEQLSEFFFNASTLVSVKVPLSTADCCLIDVSLPHDRITQN